MTEKEKKGLCARSTHSNRELHSQAPGPQDTPALLHAEWNLAYCQIMTL